MWHLRCHSCSVVVADSAGSGMCEVTNQRRLGIQVETGAKTAFQTEERCSAATTASTRKQMCFLSTQTCKPILVVTQDKIMNLKMSTLCALSFIM